MTLKGRVLSTSDMGQVEVFTTDGRKVAAGKGPEVDLSHLASGLYVAVSQKAARKILLH